MMIVFGLLFFLGTMGVWPEFTLEKYWPLVLILAGVHKLLCYKPADKDCEGCCDTPAPHHKK